MSDSVLVEGEGEFTSLGAPARAQQSRPYGRFGAWVPVAHRSRPLTVRSDEPPMQMSASVLVNGVMGR